jgi:glutamyl-tRNA reductase
VLIVNIGINYKTAPVQIREKLSFPSSLLTGILKDIKQLNAIRGCVVLSTCNRTEVYAAVYDINIAVNEIKRYLSFRAKIMLPEMEQYLYIFTCSDALQHLFQVTAGLDSMILGETQILGQTGNAYQTAYKAGTTDSIINTMFQKAIAVGKRIRTETRISQNSVSIGSAAVALVKQIYGELRCQSVLIIGAGKISELTVKNLLTNGISSVTVANRSLERAVSIAAKFGGKAIRYCDVFKYITGIDIAIVCTAAIHYIIHPQQIDKVMEARSGKPLCLIDLAVPRNIDPAIKTIKGVNLYTIDDLQDVMDINLEYRRQEAAKARNIISEELQAFRKRLSEQTVVPAIMALNKKGRDIKEQELRKALNKLPNLTNQQRNTIVSLANSIVNKLFHQPMVQLKQLSGTPEGHIYSEVLRDLFGLETGAEDASQAHAADSWTDQSKMIQV